MKIYPSEIQFETNYLLHQEPQNGLHFNVDDVQSKQRKPSHWKER